MGNTLVMTHHSDKCKQTQLAHVMTNDFRKDYGETEFHHVDIGHVHHGMVMKEHPGIFVESFNTWRRSTSGRTTADIAIEGRSRSAAVEDLRRGGTQGVAHSRGARPAGSGVYATPTEPEVYTV